MRGVGVTWDDGLIQIRCSGSSGWGVFSPNGVKEGSLLCTIPHSALLSIRTTALADVLKKERIGGGLGLTIAGGREEGR